MQKGPARPVAGVSPGRGVVARHPYLIAALGIVLATFIAGLAVPALQTFPESWQVSTGAFWSEVVRWINVNFFDALEAIRNAILLNLLVPLKRLLGDLPWAGVVALLALAGYRLGGLGLALLVSVLATLIAATGQWEKAMITVYLCGVSVVFACLIGVPLGIFAAERDRLWRWLQLVIDTLQTLPSFVYLMPVVMLFRVGDFTAMIAVVAYAVVPAIATHRAGPPARRSARGGGRPRHGLRAGPDSHQDQVEAGLAGNPCSASTRRSCSRSPCWSSRPSSARAISGRRSISR